MFYKVDYFSWTCDLPSNMKFSTEEPQVIATALLLSAIGGEICPLVIDDVWEVYKGGRIFVWRCQQPNSKFSLSFDVAKPYFQVELGGHACDFVRDRGILDVIIKLGQPRCTRIDLAVDIETDDRPANFLSNGYNPTIKAHSSISDKTGETEYVGSWNSERFARVYKYNHPNPRSHLLRVEHVHKGDWAKSAAAEYSRSGLVATTLSAASHYQWSSPIWRPAEVEFSKITAPRITPSEASKYLWLVKQVAPAIRKGMKDGWFDVHTWLLDHIFVDE